MSVIGISWVSFNYFMIPFLVQSIRRTVPLIIFDYIPGQETGNIDYVQAHQAGIYIASLQEIATKLKEWLEPDSMMSTNNLFF